jgi:hypothetical protein
MVSRQPVVVTSAEKNGLGSTVIAAFSLYGTFQEKTCSVERIYATHLARQAAT